MEEREQTNVKVATGPGEPGPAGDFPRVRCLQRIALSIR